MNNAATPSQKPDVLSQAYNATFYAGQISGALESARVMLGLLFDIYHPASVIDVGCGQGGWLAAAEELGSTKLIGVDGPWVETNRLLSRNIAFSTVNLEQNFTVSERYDLCISMEVAEHLSAGRAQAFVESLCAASDVVLFSAAIRLQGGVNHINEQWQSFWVEMFDAAGYECHDLFRPRLWTDKRVECWYRQNALLYVKRTAPLAAAVRSKSLLAGPVDIVHPDIYEGNLEFYKKALEEPTLKVCCQSVGRWSRRQLRKLFDKEKNSIS